ncbi:Sulfate/thiosulfate import ATP-binding protein CysA [Cedecea davisae]|uniref:ABC transporter, ATP-binding protein n=1 Tax=Cedecea davisae DSM 4568 TaxID=566551 RepID=S3IXP4_9ENTR|nr:ATP-binding cassette domain-containing protein [Cedecea davisae]EPF17685.1 ABC transporter, ATP-binding protein [Cedecea davisae DSM 4568]SUX28086.1 Sulfate/thiosulfate import ATP-binding protein CysA [Cedecea davisae]
MLSVQDCSIFKDGFPLLGSISFTVAAGEVVTLMGPSGSGKSTFLNWMVGDLHPPFSASGTLLLNQRRIETLPVERRRTGILFQDALLFPHLNVEQNLMMALPAAARGRLHRQSLVAKALESAGLENYQRRDPATLSGGERSRISLLRTLLAEPQALLLDEPFSRLDLPLRQSFRQFVWQEAERLGLPVVLVTHDPQDIPAGSQVIRL